MLATSVQQRPESRKGVFKKVFTCNSRQSLKKNLKKQKMLHY